MEEQPETTYKDIRSQGDSKKYVTTAEDQDTQQENVQSVTTVEDMDIKQKTVKKEKGDVRNVDLRTITLNSVENTRSLLKHTQRFRRRIPYHP